VLPGLQSYSTLPYGNTDNKTQSTLIQYFNKFAFPLGNDVFNFAVNLSFIFLPFAILLSIFSYQVSVIQICIEFAIAMVFSVYILVLSIMSPCPPFLDSSLGAILSIVSWILSQTMFMRIRCLIAARLERFGQKTLLILGTFTMLGQIFGGLIIFVTVNTYDLFKSRPDCEFDYHLYCPNY
jgi:hypothetical protein